MDSIASNSTSIAFKRIGKRPPLLLQPAVALRFFAELADDAGALIAALSYERAHIFGTSLGGASARLLAAGAKTAIIAGVGHVGTIQDPAAVPAEVLAFLQHDQAPAPLRFL